MNGAAGVPGGTSAAGEASFWAAGLGSGVEKGFCDWGDAGAAVTEANLVDAGAGMMGGTGASVFSVDRGTGLVGDAMDGVITEESVRNGATDGEDDGLFADGTAGCASGDIANGEI
jgi:hypothetical protein